MKTELLEYGYYTWPQESFPNDRYIGNNAKRMLVLANATDIPVHLTFLKKILRAVSYDFDSDLWFATMKEDESFRLLNSDMVDAVDTIILFGIAPTRIGLRVHSAERVLQFDKFRVLFAPALSVLAADENQKRTLWGLLKRTFEV